MLLSRLRLTVGARASTALDPMFYSFPGCFCNANGVDSVWRNEEVMG